MVDYNAALPQLTPYQAPNVLGMAEMANKLQLYNTMRQEKERGFAESNALRDWIKNGGDVTTPEGQRAAVALAPNAGPGFIKANLDIIGQDRINKQAALGLTETQGRINEQGPKLETSKAEAAAKILAFHRETAPIVKDQATYDIWRANLLKDAPKLAAEVDPTYSPEGMQRLIMTHDASIKEYAAQTAEQRLRNRPVNINPTEKMRGMRYDPTTNTMVEMGTGLPATANVPPPAASPAPAAAGVQPFAAPANTPVAVMRQPAAAPAVGDAQAMRTAQIEGTGKNPISSAQGLHQFIDSTFVGTAKKVFPELANKSPAEILALRGTKLADGTPIESALEQKFRADNIASLTSAGIQPTPGNVYLAHFLGAGGARNVLSADPNTPLSQVVSADAIKANPEVLALKNKTVGDLQNWANSKFGGEPGLAASMTAGNARLGGAPTGFVPAGGAPMSPGAPTVNNALMANMFGAAPSQNAWLSLQPQIPGAPTPAAAMPAAVAAAPPPAGQSPWEAQQARTQALAVKQAAAIKGAEKTAELTATQKGADDARKESASRLLKTVGGTAASDIEKLIQASTSGKLAADLADRIESVTGKSTKGMTNIEALSQIASSITFDIANGKYGNGFTDKDREAVETMSGRIADRTKASERRIAAFKQFINYMNATSEGKELAVLPPAGAATPKPAGFSVAAPGGKMYSFPTQEAMDQYKKAAGL